MRLFKAYAAAIFSVACLLAIPYLAGAQQARINVGYSAISADQLPAWVAKETGILRKMA